VGCKGRKINVVGSKSLYFAGSKLGKNKKLLPKLGVNLPTGGRRVKNY